MQTRNGQKLTYRINVFFENLTTTKSQRNTLSIWKNVRALYRKIRRQADEISASNQIVIENKELTPDVSYTFEIVGIDERQQPSDPQNFTVVYRRDFFGTQQDSSASTEQVSLLLIGSEFVYANTPIIVEAETIWCNPTNEYHMKWSMSGISDNKEAMKYLDTRGKTLRMPGGLLKAGSSHFVTVEVIGDDGHFITKVFMLYSNNKMLYFIFNTNQSSPPQ